MSSAQNGQGIRPSSSSSSSSGPRPNSSRKAGTSAGRAARDGRELLGCDNHRGGIAAVHFEIALAPRHLERGQGDGEDERLEGGGGHSQTVTAPPPYIFVVHFALGWPLRSTARFA